MKGIICAVSQINITNCRGVHVFMRWPTSSAGGNILEVSLPRFPLTILHFNQELCQTCPFASFLSNMWEEKEKRECRMSESWSLQTNLLAVLVSACGAISQTARVCWFAAAICQKWLETPAGHCGGYAAPCSTGALDRWNHYRQCCYF